MFNRMRMYNSYKKFKYKSICHKSDDNMFSNKRLVVNEIYDIYLGTYAFSDEYEIFKNGEYYTSFICEKGGTSYLETSENNIFTMYFYNKSQMRNNKLKELGI